MTSTPEVFGKLSDGREVLEYTLQNNSGIVAKILNYGGIIRVLECPDRNGRLADVVLGFDSLQEYEAQHLYFGAVIGRVAGRIDAGRLPIDGKTHHLPINARPNHLHGGNIGFDRRLWDACYRPDIGSLTMSYISPSGEEGYPGTLSTEVSYQLTDDDGLKIEYRATSDTATVVNLTQHSYFNLSGELDGEIHDHSLRILSDIVLELNDQSVPTGAEIDVSDTRFDFRQSKEIRADAIHGGLDNYWVLPERKNQTRMRSAAELLHRKSGRRMRVSTTAPGVQVYSGSHIPSELPGKQGRKYGPSSGICFETQVHPDSPNHPRFPKIILRPGALYQSSTWFQMGVS